MSLKTIGIKNIFYAGVWTILLLILGLSSFGIWTTFVFTFGFIGGFFLWLFMRSSADFREIKKPYFLTF